MALESSKSSSAPILTVVEADELTLELTGPLSPGALRPTGQSDYTYVLAPVRVAS